MHPLDYFFTIYKVQNKEVAEILGVKPPQINGWKKGERKIPEKHKVRLCELFVIPTDKEYLLDQLYTTHLNRAEIELIFHKACLSNFEADETVDLDDDITQSVYGTFKRHVEIAEDNIKLIKTIDSLKAALNKKRADALIDKNIFYDSLDKVKALIEELEGGDKK